MPPWNHWHVTLHPHVGTAGGTERETTMTNRHQTLDELLDDPMIQMVMARDGWERDDVRLLVERARSTGDEPVVPPAHVIGSECQRFWACR